MDFFLLQSNFIVQLNNMNIELDYDYDIFVRRDAHDESQQNERYLYIIYIMAAKMEIWHLSFATFFFQLQVSTVCRCR